MSDSITVTRWPDLNEKNAHHSIAARCEVTNLADKFLPINRGLENISVNSGPFQATWQQLFSSKTTIVIRSTPFLVKFSTRQSDSSLADCYQVVDDAFYSLLRTEADVNAFVCLRPWYHHNFIFCGLINGKLFHDQSNKPRFLW